MESPITRWWKGSTPFMKMLMAVSITSAVVVAHRWFYAPHVRNKRYREAEAWANMIIEQEERGEETNVRYLD